MSKNRLSLAELIRNSRIEKEISQKQLAEKLGYSSSQFVSNWERGISSPPLDKLEEICRSLGIAPNEIIETIMYETEKNLIGQFSKLTKLAK